MRQRDGVISEAIYYDVVRTSSASTYEADAVIYLVFVAVKTIQPVQMERPSGVDTSTSTDDFEDSLQSKQENESHQPVDAFVGT